MTTTASTSASVTSSDRRSRCAALLAGAALLCALLAAPAPGATEVYQEPDAFIEQVFDGAPPAQAALWLKGDLRGRVKDVLGHDYSTLRVRYWLKDGRSAWILEEIGKERPITTGILVGPEGIEMVKVLVYRESRGYEVRYPFFTDQFRGARLADDARLDTGIDNIAGATLSVRALTNLAEMALLLHRHVTDGA